MTKTLRSKVLTFFTLKKIAFTIAGCMIVFLTSSFYGTQLRNNTDDLVYVIPWFGSSYTDLNGNVFGEYCVDLRDESGLPVNSSLTINWFAEGSVTGGGYGGSTPVNNDSHAVLKSDGAFYYAGENWQLTILTGSGYYTDGIPVIAPGP